MMIFYLYLVVGITLIILEMVTTTFYLLIIGLSFIIGSLSALFTVGWIIPTILIGLLSILGCIMLKSKSKYKQRGGLVVNHIGQTVEVVELEGARFRVLYSGSYWDAVAKNPHAIKKGDILTITKFSNHLLEVE